MRDRQIVRLAVEVGLIFFLTLNAKAGLLPIKSLGHGIVCSKNVCMFTFPEKVDVISIYKYQCKPQDVYCRSAFYIDLGGRFLNLPVFKVKDNDPTNFFYKAIIGSHYNSKDKKGIRRFVMEFKTKQLPQIIWDFNTATIEVVNSDSSFKGLAVTKPKTPKNTVKNGAFDTVKSIKKRPKQVKIPTPVKVQPPKIPNVGMVSRIIKKTSKKKSVIFKKKNKKSVVVAHKNGKININFENIKLSKKVLKSPPPKKIKIKNILTFEQMGDVEFKSGHYIKALVWYRKALENAKDTQDRLRITDKIIAATTFTEKKK